MSCRTREPHFHHTHPDLQGRTTPACFHQTVSAVFSCACVCVCVKMRVNDQPRSRVEE